MQRFDICDFAVKIFLVEIFANVQLCVPNIPQRRSPYSQPIGRVRIFGQSILSRVFV